MATARNTVDTTIPPFSRLTANANNNNGLMLLTLTTIRSLQHLTTLTIGKNTIVTLRAGVNVAQLYVPCGRDGGMHEFMRGEGEGSGRLVVVVGRCAVRGEVEEGRPLGEVGQGPGVATPPSHLPSLTHR